MRNLISYFALVSILFFASCTKEALIAPQIGGETVVAERSTTIQLPVEEVSSTTFGGQLTVHFAGEDDFTGVVLEDTQYLDFEDASSNASTLTFQVVNFAGSNGSLQATFSIGTNDLNGLTLVEMQEIIIEDVALE